MGCGVSRGTADLNKMVISMPPEKFFKKVDVLDFLEQGWTVNELREAGFTFQQITTNWLGHRDPCTGYEKSLRLVARDREKIGEQRVIEFAAELRQAGCPAENFFSFGF